MISSRNQAGCRGPVYYLRAFVGQDDVRPLAWLQARWGGNVRRKPTPRISRVHHVWLIQGKTAAAFLWNVLPFLQVKAAQASLAIAFQQGIHNPGCRGLADGVRAARLSVKLEMSRLNHMATKHPEFKHDDAEPKPKRARGR